jgi:hypothetical protein
MRMKLKMFNIFHIYFSTGDDNRHGTQKHGEKWNQQTVHGPKLAFFNLFPLPECVSKRAIFYFPSGACWYFDFYCPILKIKVPAENQGAAANVPPTPAARKPGKK